MKKSDFIGLTALEINHLKLYLQSLQTIYNIYLIKNNGNPNPEIRIDPENPIYDLIYSDKIKFDYKVIPGPNPFIYSPMTTNNKNEPRPHFMNPGQLNPVLFTAQHQNYYFCNQNPNSIPSQHFVSPMYQNQQLLPPRRFPIPVNPVRQDFSYLRYQQYFAHWQQYQVEFTQLQQLQMCMAKYAEWRQNTLRRDYLNNVARNAAHKYLEVIQYESFEKYMESRQLPAMYRTNSHLHNRPRAPCPEEMTSIIQNTETERYNSLLFPQKENEVWKPSWKDEDSGAQSFELQHHLQAKQIQDSSRSKICYNEPVSSERFRESKSISTTRFLSSESHKNTPGYGLSDSFGSFPEGILPNNSNYQPRNGEIDSGETSVPRNHENHLSSDKDIQLVPEKDLEADKNCSELIGTYKNYAEYKNSYQEFSQTSSTSRNFYELSQTVRSYNEYSRKFSESAQWELPFMNGNVQILRKDMEKNGKSRVTNYLHKKIEDNFQDMRETVEFPARNSENSLKNPGINDFFKVPKKPKEQEKKGSLLTSDDTTSFPELQRSQDEYKPSEKMLGFMFPKEYSDILENEKVPQEPSKIDKFSEQINAKKIDVRNVKWPLGEPETERGNTKRIIIKNWWELPDSSDTELNGNISKPVDSEELNDYAKARREQILRNFIKVLGSLQFPEVCCAIIEDYLVVAVEEDLISYPLHFPDFSVNPNEYLSEGESPISISLKPFLKEMLSIDWPLTAEVATNEELGAFYMMDIKSSGFYSDNAYSQLNYLCVENNSRKYKKETGELPRQSSQGKVQIPYVIENTLKSLHTVDLELEEDGRVWSGSIFDVSHWKNWLNDYEDDYEKFKEKFDPESKVDGIQLPEFNLQILTEPDVKTTYDLIFDEYDKIKNQSVTFIPYEEARKEFENKFIKLFDFRNPSPESFFILNDAKPNPYSLPKDRRRRYPTYPDFFKPDDKLDPTNIKYSEALMSSCKSSRKFNDDPPQYCNLNKLMPNCSSVMRSAKNNDNYFSRSAENSVYVGPISNQAKANPGLIGYNHGEEEHVVWIRGKPISIPKKCNPAEYMALNFDWYQHLQRTKPNPRMPYTQMFDRSSNY